MPIRQAGKAQDSDSCIRAFEPLIGNYKEICGVEQLVACWAHNPEYARSSRNSASKCKHGVPFSSNNELVGVYELRDNNSMVK